MKLRYWPWRLITSIGAGVAGVNGWDSDHPHAGYWNILVAFVSIWVWLAGWDMATSEYRERKARHEIREMGKRL